MIRLFLSVKQLIDRTDGSVAKKFNTKACDSSEKNVFVCRLSHSSLLRFTHSLKHTLESHEYQFQVFCFGAYCLAETFGESVCCVRKSEAIYWPKKYCL